MFTKPVKTAEEPLVYSSSCTDKKQDRSKNEIDLVSGSVLKLKKEVGIEEDISKMIYSNCKEWFGGRNFSLDKIRSSLKVECLLSSKTRCVSAIYDRDVNVEELYKYCGSKISFVYSIEKIDFKGKDILVIINLHVVKVYKKDRLEKKYLINEDSNELNETCEDSEVSDDEISIEDEEDSEDFFV